MGAPVDFEVSITQLNFVNILTNSQGLRASDHSHQSGDQPEQG